VTSNHDEKVQLLPGVLCGHDVKAAYLLAMQNVGVRFPVSASNNQEMYMSECRCGKEDCPGPDKCVCGDSCECSTVKPVYSCELCMGASVFGRPARTYGCLKHYYSDGYSGVYRNLKGELVQDGDVW
jgi:hypothetical protein